MNRILAALSVCLITLTNAHANAIQLADADSSVPPIPNTAPQTNSEPTPDTGNLGDNSSENNTSTTPDVESNDGTPPAQSM